MSKDRRIFPQISDAVGVGTEKWDKASSRERELAVHQALQGLSGRNIRRVGPPPPDEHEDEEDDDGLYREMDVRARLEDEYGGGAGDWD